MEKSKNLVAVPYQYKWSDLGDWNSVWSESKSNKSGVVLSLLTKLIVKHIASLGK